MASRRASKPPPAAKAATTPSLTENSLAFRMLIWARYYSTPLYAEMEKRFGILQDEFAVLASLYPDVSVSAKTICALTGRPKNSISRGVARLIESGRIKSVTNQNDRRESHLSMLAEGRKLFEKIMPTCQDREVTMMECLTPAELAMLDQLTAKLVDHYNKSPSGLSEDY